jgi:DNA-binding MarR family transcriptional regulator
MKYIDLLNHFWTLNKEYSFTPNEKAVYFALLYKWNDLHRKNPFNLSREELARDAGVSVSSVKRARVILEKANLLAYNPGDGRRNNTIYSLKYGNKEVLSEPLSPNKGSHSEPLLSNKGVHKAVHSEPLYNENSGKKGSTVNHYISNDIEESIVNVKKGEERGEEEENHSQKLPVPLGNSSVYSSMDDVEIICLTQSTVWLESMTRRLSLKNLEEAKNWVIEFFEEQRAAGQDKRDLSDAKSHCYSWVKIQKEKNKSAAPKGKAEAALKTHDAMAAYWEEQEKAHLQNQRANS